MTVANAQSPFLNLASFVSAEAETQNGSSGGGGPLRSPFMSVYEAAGVESDNADPSREAYAEIVSELYDEEFDEALFELMSEVRNLHHERLGAGHSPDEAERFVTRHIAQLTRECEAAVDSMSRQFGGRDAATILDHEVEAFAGEFAPSAPLEPAFENFFGKLVKKIGGAVKKVAGKVVKGAIALGLGPVLMALKKLVAPFLKNVLSKAIGKLPPALQPAARSLAQRLGFAVSAPAPAASNAAPANGGAEPALPAEDVTSPVQEPSGAGVTELQLLLDQQIAEAMLVQDEAELEMEMSRRVGGMNEAAAPVYSDLDQARERFINELENLKEGEDPTPYVENFLPFVTSALSLGLRIAGRQRVIGTLSSLLAAPIKKLIGPQYAPVLAKAIVNTGFKMLNLEAPARESSALAASTVAATVEETLNPVAALPDEVRDNQELLEGFALEAFEQAAASNLPPLLPATTYRARPELLEAGLNAGWVMLPLRGPKRYKRCTRTFDVRITPYMAEEVESFEGAPLSDYLHDQLGLPEGQDVEVEMHLFEALPGTTVADIARAEGASLGLETSGEMTTAQLHPLTPQAAGALLGKPALGRTTPPGADSRNLAAGQRLFYAAVAGARPRPHAGAGGQRRPLRRSHANVTLNCTQGVIRVCVYISESRTQKFAVALRQQAHGGAVAVGFHKFIARRLRSVFDGRRPRGLRVVKAGVPPVSPQRRLPEAAAAVFSAKLQQWLTQGFAEFAKAQAQRFLAVADEPADGLTLVMTIERPQGLQELGQLIAGNGAPASKLADILQQGGAPSVRVEVIAGHKCD